MPVPATGRCYRSPSQEGSRSGGPAFGPKPNSLLGRGALCRWLGRRYRGVCFSLEGKAGRLQLVSLRKIT